MVSLEIKYKNEGGNYIIMELRHEIQSQNRELGKIYENEAGEENIKLLKEQIVPNTSHTWPAVCRSSYFTKGGQTKSDLKPYSAEIGGGKTGDLWYSQNSDDKTAFKILIFYQAQKEHMWLPVSDMVFTENNTNAESQGEDDKCHTTNEHTVWT